MIALKQAVVVEGRYDRNVLLQLVDAPVFETNGFGVMNDPELVSLLREAAKTRGLIILTDSDGAGFVIRNYLKSVLPKENVLHAYIPDLPGKERRKRVPGKEGLLGVEGMRPEVIIKALENAGAELGGEREVRCGPAITKADLYAAGLSGRPDSEKRRLELKKRLGLPAHLSANGLLQALNLLGTREAFLAEYDNEEPK
jgi:ribonuclease M5